ncbi:signal peptide peptidase SppA [bacterium]|nr:signal peptide peptidase SppA [bacterium]
MKNKSTVILLSLFGFCFVSLLIVMLYNLVWPDVSFGRKVALIELDGEIFDSRDIVRQFKKFRDDASVEAIVFRIESPGGGITPSQEIYDIIKKIRAGGKPVIASMGSVAASGGYYVACAADTIVANPGTITGSIGVIIQYPNVDKLLEKVGVKFTTIKSGQFKDALSPYRDMTKNEADYMQNFVMNAYEQFVQMVVLERQLDTAYVRQYADGRVFTGQQAKDLQLVDVLGTYDDAILIAAQRAGIEGEPQVVREKKHKPSLFEMFFDEDAGAKIGSFLPEFKSYPVISYKYGF